MQATATIRNKAAGNKLVSLFLEFSGNLSPITVDAYVAPENSQIHNAGRLFYGEIGESFLVEIEPEPPGEYDSPETKVVFKVVGVTRKLTPPFIVPRDIGDKVDG